MAKKFVEYEGRWYEVRETVMRRDKDGEPFVVEARLREAPGMQTFWAHIPFDEYTRGAVLKDSTNRK